MVYFFIKVDLIKSIFQENLLYIGGVFMIHKKLLKKFYEMQYNLNINLVIIKPQIKEFEYIINPIKKINTPYDFGVSADIIGINAENYSDVEKFCKKNGINLEIYEYFANISLKQFLPLGSIDYLVFKYGSPENMFKMQNKI